MRKVTKRKALAIGAGVTLVAAGVALAPTAFAQPGLTRPQAEVEPGELFSDDLPNPYEEARRAARDEAIAGVLSGRLTTEEINGSTVVDLHGPSNGGSGGSGHYRRTQYVELARETEDRIFVVLTEFGDEGLASIPPAANAQRTTGPLHNEIPEPDRAVDNATVWQADYSEESYEDIYFGEGDSLKTYYEMQSSGRYSVAGDVTDWTFVPYSERRYGTDLCGSNVCSTVKLLVRDSANAWYNDQIAAGRTLADIQAELATFDIWDRYDYDGDGNFNEPDGFLDHFQVVHAGGDQADGDPIYGDDAIWSHRWYSNLAFSTTCSDYLGGCLTGTQVGNTGFWIGDYTMQPENGGRSVFYHEYGHDLGLPDDYNTGGTPGDCVVAGCGDNNSEHWTLMAQSRLGGRHDGGIGERAGDLGAWNKLQLGWLNYDLRAYDEHATIQLGPEEYNTNKPQALIVLLPDKEVSTDVGAPYAGAGQWYSGHADDTTVTLSTDVTISPGSSTLTFKTRYDIEVQWDVAQVLVDGTPVVGTVNGVQTVFSTDELDPTHNFNGFTVGWDQTSAGWVDGSFDLSAYADGGTHQLTFLYFADAAVSGNDPSQPDGVFFDDITLGGTVIGDAESTTGWTATPADGFEAIGSETTASYLHYYIAGYRSYVSYDRYLQTGPYFFGYANTKPDWVDHYPYQDGLLVSYTDTSYTDNATWDHPGHGLNLYVDAHPAPMPQASGPYGYWRSRVQVYDAPFGLSRTDRVALHVNGQRFTFGGLPGNPVFRDTDDYFAEAIPNHGVILPGYGVTIRVLSEWGGRMVVRLN